MSHPDVVAPGEASFDHLIVIDASKSTGWPDFHELWEYRGLIWIIAIRDITVRYRQTVVGIAWTVLQPLSLMFAFGLFKKMVATESAPEAIAGQAKVLCGLVLYQLFSGIISVSTPSLVENRQMLTKVYFPRFVLPLAASIRPLADFGFGLLLIVLSMVWYGISPTPALILSPVIVALTVTASLALGLWLSALNAHYRDFGHLVPFALQLGLIVSPVVFDSSHVPGRWRWLYFANPMASLLDLFKWSMLGAPYLPAWYEMLISLLATAFLLATGAWYFRRVDRFLADNI